MTRCNLNLTHSSALLFLVSDYGIATRGKLVTQMGWGLLLLFSFYTCYVSCASLLLVQILHLHLRRYAGWACDTDGLILGGAMGRIGGSYSYIGRGFTDGVGLALVVFYTCYLSRASLLLVQILHLRLRRYAGWGLRHRWCDTGRGYGVHRRILQLYRTGLLRESNGALWAGLGRREWHTHNSE